MPLSLRALTALGSVLFAAVACAQEAADKPVLSLSADTMKMSIPGLENIKLPPEAQAALGASFGAQRSLHVSLTRPGKTPEAPTATLDVPEGLRLGPSLLLQVDPPGNPGNEGGGFPGGKIPDFEMLRYWGCSKTVRPGQPKAFSTKDLNPGILAGIPRPGQRPGRIAAGVLNGTDAYWPNSKNRPAGQIQAGAGLPGAYALHSNFVPGVSFTVPAAVTFLEPVALTLPQAPNALESFVPVQWKPVPGAVGYVAMATGMKGQRSMIMWTSAEGEDGMAAAFNDAADPKALVAKGALLPPDRTECFIPEAIFKGCQGVSVQLIAVGPTFVQNDSTPAVRVRTRSTGMSMLGVGNFGGLGGLGRGKGKEDEDQ